MRLTFFVAALCAACAAPTQERPGDRGMRASDHREAVREENDAAQRVRWPDRPPSADGSVASSAEAAAGTWFYYRDTAVDHERLAEIHAAAAERIEAEYQAACGDAPAAQVSVSPIVRYAIGGGPIAHGASVYLSPDAGSPAHVLAAMRCHRAWMMLGRSLMDDCPLDLAGIELAAHAVPGAIEVQITVDDPALVPEIQRRAAKDVEAAATRVDGAPRR